MNSQSSDPDQSEPDFEPGDPLQGNDPELGVPGDAEPLPQDDDLQEEVTHVNDDDDLDDEDDD